MAYDKESKISEFNQEAYYKKCYGLIKNSKLSDLIKKHENYLGYLKIYDSGDVDDTLENIDLIYKKMIIITQLLNQFDLPKLRCLKCFNEITLETQGEETDWYKCVCGYQLGIGKKNY